MQPEDVSFYLARAHGLMQGNGRNVDSDRNSTSMPLHDTFTVSLSCPGLLPHPLSCSINVSDYEDNVLYSAGYFWCYCAVAIGRFLKFMPRFYDM